jgi:hypothetical protein
MARAHDRRVSVRGIGMALTMGLLLLTWLLAAPGTETGAADPGNQCQICHTDAAKLKALTPPDPPSEEEGEG